MEYAKRRWRQQALRAYAGKQRTFARFHNDFVSSVRETYPSSTPITVAYGSAHINPTGRGEVSAPTSRAFSECLHRPWMFRTELVDEFRTSRYALREAANVTAALLQAVRNRSTQRAVRGLQWLPSATDRQGTAPAAGSDPAISAHFVNRDLNSALNIRLCLMLGQQASSRNSHRGILIYFPVIWTCQAAWQWVQLELAGSRRT